LAVGELVGAFEIATMLRLSRQRIQQLVARNDFPAPVQTLAMGKIWRKSDIVEWAIKNGRETDQTVNDS